MSDHPNPPGEPLVVDVVPGGAMAGLSAPRSYAAAKDGSMPTIEIAGRKKVPLALWRSILNGEMLPRRTAAAAEDPSADPRPASRAADETA